MLNVAEIEGVTNPNLPLWFTKIALDFVHPSTEAGTMFFGANALESPHLDQGKKRSNPSSGYYSGMMLMQMDFFFWST